MLNLTRAIDRATGYVFIPQAGAQIPEDAVADPSVASSARPNAYALISSAMGPRAGPRSDVREVQERWVDAREEWDAYEKAQWRREGEALRQAAAEVEKQKKLKLNIRERK
jgi:GPN-loop GTPase